MATKARKKPAAKPKTPGKKAGQGKPLKSQMVSVTDLVPYANNARTHSEDQIAAIAASITEFGFLNPVLVDANCGIIAGHGRLSAAKLLGMAKVPTILVDHLTEAQQRAYIIADNKLALDAGWDPTALGIEFKELDLAGFDLALTGFDTLQVVSFIAGLDANSGLTDPDAAPELQEAAVTRLGDTWLCGKHRVRCGDSTSAEDVGALLGDIEPHLMVTDPPYGVEYDANWRNEAEGVGGFGDPKKAKSGYNSTRAVGKVQNDGRVDWSEAWALFPGDVAYVWHAGIYAGPVAESLQSNGLNLRSQIIWVKPRFPISRGDYHWQHEPCWYAVRKGKKGHYCGGRKQSTTWEIPHNKSDTGHSTQKPIECMKRPIENNSSPGQAVYDPFLGSGTTVIAAEQTARACYGMELSPNYVDVIVRRWQEFTGQSATLEASGKTFKALEATRCKAAARA